nr:MAG TPA: hypothetical protein [Crassvirales sp.]
MQVVDLHHCSPHYEWGKITTSPTCGRNIKSCDYVSLLHSETFQK